MDRKITIVGLACLLIVALAIVLNMVFLKPASFRGTAYGEPFPAAKDFTLTDAGGNRFKLSEGKGRITLLFFGYTYCPDVCPTTLSELRLAVDELGEASRQVQVVFISVDPGRDTSASMQEYVERFNPAFIGLSGTIEELQPIWDGYGVFREVVDGSSESNYIINHTARVTLIDQSGNMRLSYGFQTPPEDIAHDIEILLSK